ncbi:GH36-type glycosyl hydrolase domain-containing protein [Hydrogenophaga taeniospiralis]|nr:glucoamylase family protein [Hydrogenophaga taeniospiralis]
MLDAARGVALEPIRSELFGVARFEQHGRSLGESHRAGRAGFGQATFYPRLQSNIRSLRAAYQYIAVEAHDGHDISPAAEWLFDNFHLIESQLREIREGLPARYYRSLPVLQDAPLVGLPRIYGVAWAFVAHTDSAFDETLLGHFLDAYQDTRELSQGELWALPTTLRVVLVENLRRLADRIASHKAARDFASLCASRIGELSLGAVTSMRELMEQRGVGDVFLSHLAQSLVGHATAATDSPLAQVRRWLQDVVPDLAALQAQHHAAQAADHLSVGNAVTALRLIGAADWPGIVARTSRVVRVMLRSPVFKAEDDATRDATLHGIERLSTQSGQGEAAVAQVLLVLMDGASGPAALAGHWLRGEGRTTLEQALGLKQRVAGLWRSVAGVSRTPAYLGAMGVGTVLLVAWLLQRPGWLDAGWPAQLGSVLVGLVMLLPASEAVVAVLNRLIGESVKPVHLPRLLLAEGIPPQARVMVVVPALLNHPAGIAQTVHRLHLHHLANPEAHAQFALLSDWCDADTEHRPEDQSLLSYAQDQLAALNTRHPVAPGSPPRFLLLHRPRSHSATQGQWLGWERKRGKLEQLVAALATGTPGPFFELGELSRTAPHTRYIFTLDSDTQLPPGRLRTLVGVAEHPDNQPRLDASGRRVLQGYGILQPRVVQPLAGEGVRTAWQWLFDGQTGIDPYSAMSSDVYQDLFGEGSFTGKGLLHVPTLHAVLGKRLPSEQVLSHDLLEGALVRCAVVTDVTLIEPEPDHADAAASRLHRWARGDWQLLPFLLRSRQWPLGAINRWKLFDNLRRSLVAPACLLLVGLAMAGLGVSLPAALALTVAAYTAGPLMGALAGWVPRHWRLLGQRYAVAATLDLLRALGGGLWHLALLPQQAVLALDAVLRTLHRLLLSRRHLLEWTTAEAAQAGLGTGLLPTLWRHRAESLAALTLAGLLWLFIPAPGALALAVLGLWALAPLLVWLCNTPRRPRPALAAADRELLEGVARDTWRLFERCVDADNHHLPPDNLQTMPYEMVAHRTSPTNIGLYLLSTACARQFGWIGTQDLLTRLEATLATLQRMERHRGHFLNWYDTRTLHPLPPRYVSTVDSGNLSAHLLTVAQACTELAHEPHAAQPGAEALRLSRQRLQPRLGLLQTLLHRPLEQTAIGRLLETPMPEPCEAAACAAFFALLQEASHELGGLTQLRNPAIVSHVTTPQDELAWLLSDHLATLHSAGQDAAAMGAGSCERATGRLRSLAAALEALAWAPDFHCLYNPRRHLLHIGYRLEEQQLDASYYDLLASESRSTSLLAIAKGELPVRHWAALGRPFFASGRRAVLRSWSGSMFEYLMPSLVVAEPRGSALREAGRSALQEQIAFVDGTPMPWGISESAYAGQDHTLAYQYAPQGVPRLALRRTPLTERVIAPYATVLATQVDAALACENLRRLAALSARGRYGFCEALDYTPTRQTHGDRFTVVHTFMAHHQGMSLVALANVLRAGVAQRWGMAHPRMQAVASLLHERAPRELPALLAPLRLPLQALQSRTPDHIRTLIPGAQALEPTHLLGNGRYSVTLRPNGAGWSRWGQTGITRWRDDALRDACGAFVYLRLGASGAPVSVTSHPAPDPHAAYSCRFHTDRVCFDALWPELRVNTTVWVSPEDDVELRKVVLSNLSDETIELELISALDVTLASHAADEAHPAFSNLFVKTDWLPEQQALRCVRAPRLVTEQTMQAAHFVADTEGEVLGLRCQTDRLRWLGRHHTPAQPLAQMDPVPLEAGPLETGLDPVAALGVRLRIAPGAQAIVTFATAASDDAATLCAVIDKYRQPSYVARSSVMSATLAGISAVPNRPRTDYLPVLHALTTALVLTLPKVAPPHPGPANAPPQRSDRRLLWPLGLSGERPLLLVHAGASQGLGLLRVLALVLREWSRAGVACDLVVLSHEAHSYHMPLQRELTLLLEQHAADLQARPGPAVTGLYLLRADDLSAEQIGTLRSLARVQLQADGQALLHQVRAWCDCHETPTASPWRGAPAVPDPVPLHLGEVAAAPAEGVFADDLGAFAFEVNATQTPQRPWCNVLANPGFGALLSESGGGNTWALNSRLNQLTAWANDPVGDPPSECFLLQDRRTREVWSLTPSAWAAEGITYEVVHGQGLTTISHRRGPLAVSVSWCVDAETAVKQVRIHLRNHGNGKAHLRITGLVEWMMGEKRSDRASLLSQPYFVSPPGAGLIGLLCTQTEAAGGFGEGTAFFCESNEGVHDPEGMDWTCDRAAFFDRQGQLVLPQRLGQRSGFGLDPCAALSRPVTLRPGAALDQVFLIGYAPSPEAARTLMRQATASNAREREHLTRARWKTLLGATQVATPDPLFDTLVNHWLLYQTVSSRLWAKAGFYQAGGATGYRDQLQDAMALVGADPAILRAQIVLCASRQFEAGDVQHWWHAPGGAGVRTHFSDDLLWLPLATTHYLQATGDKAVLDEAVPFLEGAPLPEGAEDRYDTPGISHQTASVYEHGARAIDHSLPVGAHGLPLMGSGDWNDGMNRVGSEGRGESVWLAWFLCSIVSDWLPLARARGERDRARAWEAALTGWRTALGSEAWDGAWFKRAFFDDGSPLGSATQPEARIDLIAQAWSVLSGQTSPERQRQAMDAVEAQLVDRAHGLIRLLDPPLQHAQPSAGYIQAYPPGVRENGGQYAHAGVWALMAAAVLAQREPGNIATHDTPYRYFTYLSPAHRAAHADWGPRYGVEPYVMAADVYSQPPYEGRGGWSWYTGAAGWLHRAALGSILGLQIGAEDLFFTPCLPSHWPRAELTLLRDGRRMRFVLLRGDAMAALADCGVPNARLLGVGERLRWTDLPQDSCFVVPLPPVA